MISFPAFAGELPPLPNQDAISKKAYDEAYKSPKCTFTYFLTDSEKGKILAAEAKTECAANAAFKATSKPEHVSYEAYNMWKDNQQLVLMEKIFNK